MSGIDYPRSSPPGAEQEPNRETIQHIFRGIWATRLTDNEELPVGGSLFSRELTTRLRLDFASFDAQLENFTEENIRTAYEKSKNSVQAWLKKTNSDIDPFIYFLCFQVQQKVEALLDVAPNGQNNSSERETIYRAKESPKLSALKGKSECAERAALGQYLFQRAGVTSSYVSGISMKDAHSRDEFPVDHSFLVLENPNKKDTSLIFDIARPRSAQHVPRVLETDVAFNYNLLNGQNDMLVGATEVLQGKRLWFGVGQPAAGTHKTIEKPS